MIQCEACRRYNERKNSFGSSTEVTFIASNGWLQKFFARNGITLRRRTTICQKLPTKLAPKLGAFFAYMRKIRAEHGHALSEIGAMDEMPVWLDMPADCTVDFVGSKDVPVKSTGNEKARITVVLAAKANGTKLPPYLVFKGKRMDKELLNVKGVICAMSSNGWINEELTLDWLTRAWGTLTFKRRLLCWDSFKCHIQDSVKERVRKLKTDMAVVPGGCTSLVQAPDVSWNKPFKAHYQELYEEWLADEQPKPCTKGGNVKNLLQKLRSHCGSSWLGTRSRRKPSGNLFLFVAFPMQLTILRII
jgi:hypothetical protein